MGGLGFRPYCQYFIIKRGKVSVRTYVRTSVTLGVPSSVASDVIMRIAGLVADGAGRRYGDWRHVATGCNALGLVLLMIITKMRIQITYVR